MDTISAATYLFHFMRKPSKKQSMTRPTVPKSVNLDDAENPKRTADFSAALAKGGVQGAVALRALVDAYIRFVTERGHVPNLPLSITGTDVPKKK